VGMIQYLRADGPAVAPGGAPVNVIQYPLADDPAVAPGGAPVGMIQYLRADGLLWPLWGPCGHDPEAWLLLHYMEGKKYKKVIDNNIKSVVFYYCKQYLQTIKKSF